ncbi:MAG: hypothetical protein WD823_09745 [Sulfuricaulis sp.]|uniref:hypothetical protein n=1 Tax=Sulfuricaulis sp. TaxID=2003553 RepID=UPI0034A3438C
MFEIERGKPLHCVEMVTGKSLTGTLLISVEEISARIYSYTEFFFIEDNDQPVILLTETNHIVSLHSNITTVPGRTSRTIEPKRTIHRQDFVSNLAIVGHDPWMSHDKVKRVTFVVEHTKQLMRHKRKVKAIGRGRYPKEGDLTIFTDDAQGMTLRAGYTATYGSEFDSPKELWPGFEIEFDAPQSTTDYIVHVSDYVDFLSFCLGVKLKPTAIRVDRISFDQMKAAVKSQSYLGDHGVHYVWPETEIDKRDLWVGGSPVRSWDDEELSSFRACLVAWMNRAAEWRRSYALMMVSFGAKNVISAERLINACRWLEEVPIAQSQNALSSEEVEAISTAATQKAHELGHHQIIRERIAGAVKRVRAESAEERFTRLVAMLEEKFGKGILRGSVVAHLKRAIQFRSRVAHGHFNPESDVEFRAFAKSTKAMEAFCYLLTALDLPISKMGLERIRSNPLVRDYKHAYD